MSAVLEHRRELYAIRDLPTLPVIAQRVLTLADDDESGLEKLAGIISSDQALSIRVLTLANSAYYGHRAKIGTIRHAIVVIGMGMLKQLALGVMVRGMMGRSGAGRFQFWKHCFGTAMAASDIAKRTHTGDQDLCFMAGLLHDVGRLIIASYFPDDKTMEHTEVGGWMAERWQLPVPLVNAIAHHHSIAPEHLVEPIVACVHAADVAAKLAASEECPEIAPEVLKALSITPADFQKIIEDLKNRKSEIERFIS